MEDQLEIDIEGTNKIDLREILLGMRVQSMRKIQW